MLIYDLTLPNFEKVDKNLQRLVLIRDLLNEALNGRMLINEPKRLQTAYDLKYLISKEIIEYEDWMEACIEYVNENKEMIEEEQNGK